MLPTQPILMEALKESERAEAERMKMEAAAAERKKLKRQGAKGRGCLRGRILNGWKESPLRNLRIFTLTRRR